MPSRHEHCPGNTISSYQTAPTSLLICNVIILDLINGTEYLIMRIAFISIYLHIFVFMVLQPFVGPWPLFQFLNLLTQSVGLLGRGISRSQGRYLQTGQHKQKIKTLRHAWIHVLDRAATVIGRIALNMSVFSNQRSHNRSQLQNTGNMVQ
jgi:hypothetical protein